MLKIIEEKIIEIAENLSENCELSTLNPSNNFVISFLVETSINTNQLITNGMSKISESTGWCYKLSFESE